MKGYFEFMVNTNNGGRLMRYTVPVDSSSQYTYAVDIVKSVFPNGKVSTAKFVDTDQLELQNKREERYKEQSRQKAEEERLEREILKNRFAQQKHEKEILKKERQQEQKRLEKEKIAQEKAQKKAEKQRIKAEKQKERKIEALAKGLPEDEKKEYDIQYEAFQNAKEQFETETHNVDFKIVMIPLLFFSVFVFVYTLFNVVEQYHSGKLTSFSDIYSSANNIIFLIALIFASWASISFQKYLFKPIEDNSLIEKISSILAFITLITTYILFRNKYDLTYISVSGLVSLSLFGLSYVLYKKRLYKSLIPFEDEMIIQEDKYKKLIRRLNLT